MDPHLYRSAHERISAKVRRTPLIPAAPHAPELPHLSFKAECLQVSGSFKARGAYNAVLSMTEGERRRGVVTASGGNFGAALAYAARDVGLPATIFVMESSTPYTHRRIRNYGAEPRIEGRFWEDTWEAARRFAEESGARLFHPFADEVVILGQGTIGLEILEDCPDVDTVVVAIGGGGLIAGIAEAVKQRRPEARIVGVEAEGAPTLHAARTAGRIVTLETMETRIPILGARTTCPINFDMVHQYVDELVLVPDDDVRPWLDWVWSTTGLAIELGAATAVAAVMGGHVHLAPSERIAVVLCGSGTDALVAAAG